MLGAESSGTDPGGNQHITPVGIQRCRRSSPEGPTPFRELLVLLSSTSRHFCTGNLRRGGFSLSQLQRNEGAASFPEPIPPCSPLHVCSPLLRERGARGLTNLAIISPGKVKPCWVASAVKVSRPRREGKVFHAPNSDVTSNNPTGAKGVRGCPKKQQKRGKEEGAGEGSGAGTQQGEERLSPGCSEPKNTPEELSCR